MFDEMFVDNVQSRNQLKLSGGKMIVISCSI